MADNISIDIPIDLYKLIEREARFGEEIAETLRRILRERTGSPGSPSAGVAGRGYLLDLIRAGKLKSGQRLILDLPRKGAHHEASVTASGQIELEDGRTFSSPTGAANACLGGSNNGWRAWAVEDGRTLDDLRTEMRKGQ